MDNSKTIKVVDSYKTLFSKIDNLEQLKVSIQESFNKVGIQIIEAKIQIEDNVKEHKKQ